MPIRNIGSIGVLLNAKTAAFNASMTGAQGAVMGVGAAADVTSAKLAGMGMMMTTAVTLPLLAAGGVGVKFFADFEKGMRNVNVIARQNEEDFRATSEAALDLATTLGKSPTELADALYNINSASFKATQGLEVLEAATVAGRAGLASTADAAKAITAVLNAYGKSAAEAGDVSDILFKTVEKGVLTFGELATQLGAVVASGAAANIEFDEIAAGIATMTRGGIQSAEAFTAMNRMIQRMIKGTAELDALFQKYGFDSAFAALSTIGLGKTMAILSKETKGGAKNLVNLGFRIRDLKAALSLTRDEGRAFAGDLEEIAKKSARAGSTMDAFEEQTKSLTFQIERLVTIIKVNWIRTTELFASNLKSVVDVLQRVATWFGSLDDTTKKWLVSILALVAAIGPVMLIMSGLLKIVGILTALISTGFIPALALLIVSMVVLGRSMADTFGKGETRTERFIDMLKQLGAWLKKTWQTVVKVGRIIVVVWQAAWEQVSMAIDIVYGNILTFLDTLKENFKRVVGFLKDNWRAALNEMLFNAGVLSKNLMMDFAVLIGWLARSWLEVWKNIAKNAMIIFNNMIPNIATLFQALFTALTTRDFSKVMKVMGMQIEKAFQGTVALKISAPSLTPLTEGMKNEVFGALELIEGSYRSLSKESGDLWGRAAEKIKAIWEETAKETKSVLKDTEAASKIVEDTDTDIPDLAKKAVTVQAKFAGAAEKGSVEAHRAELGNMRWQDKSLKAQEKGNQTLESINETLASMARAPQPETVSI